MRRGIAMLGLVAAAVMVSSSARAAETMVLTRISEVRSLTRDNAGRGFSVRLRGVVTWRLRQQLTFQDESGGVWVDVSEARQRGLWVGDDDVFEALREGQNIEIEGVSSPGSYSPNVVPATIRVLGTKELPTARPTTPARFFSGAEAGQRIEMSGVVQGYRELSELWELRMNADPGRFSVRIRKEMLERPGALIDAEVRFRGVGSTRSNTRGEIVEPLLCSGLEGDILVEKPALPLAKVPLVPLDRLQPFRPEPAGPHRLRIAGTVTFCLPGQFLYLQEGRRAVRVDTRSPLDLKAGDRVEAMGFVEMPGPIARLVGATVSKTGEGRVPAVEVVTPEEIVAINEKASHRAQSALPHDYDGHLIRFRAKLLAVQGPPDPKQGWRRLTLEQGRVILGGILHQGDFAVIDGLRPGSELEVTGIVQLGYQEGTLSREFNPGRLDLMVRDAGDVVVLRAPSWWTPGRTYVALLGVLALAVSALSWAAALRRTVAKQTRQLAAEMRGRRDAAVEFRAALRERSRLAANLHDTVLQTMTGIAYQIEACESESLPTEKRPANHLETARRMVQRGQEDLRNSVWAMRALPMKDATFPDAVRRVARQIAAGNTAQIHVETAGELPALADFIAGNLLLIVQEAVHNAIKHAAPKHIRVTLDSLADGARLALVVEDDGAGFDTGRQPGASEGHFGLVGMRERAESLGGTIILQSEPGKGTRLRVELPILSFDHDLD